jgi:hypothetical protein
VRGFLCPSSPRDARASAERNPKIVLVRELARVQRGRGETRGSMSVRMNASRHKQG